MKGNTVAVTPASSKSTISSLRLMNGFKRKKDVMIMPIIKIPEAIAIPILLESVPRKRKNGNPNFLYKMSGISKNRTTFAIVFNMYSTSRFCSIQIRIAMLISGMVKKINFPKKIPPVNCK